MFYSPNNKRTSHLRVASQRSLFFTVLVTQLLITTLFLCARTLFAQQLPVRHYNVEDGLGHSIVGAIYQDSKGYIWFGTADGLSRFDG
ncbi:MAG TPA: two-component regulator propeller domain-containing protein [Blastocatellia bacterium]|nr:two-component regulator propeller domain-containing protein [Blastocatellia bacterium]